MIIIYLIDLIVLIYLIDLVVLIVLSDWLLKSCINFTD